MWYLNAELLSLVGTTPYETKVSGTPADPSNQIDAIFIKDDESLSYKAIAYNFNNKMTSCGEPETVTISLITPLPVGTKHHFIEPGKPQQNGHVESFNSLLRTMCLNQHWFLGLEDCRELINSWMYEYNWIRCHRSIGRIPPGLFAQQERQKDGPPSAPTSNGSHSRGASALRNEPELLTS